MITLENGTVRQGKRTIGFIRLWTIRGESAWRFVANRKDISEQYPIPAPKFDTEAATLAHVKATLETA